MVLHLAKEIRKICIGRERALDLKGSLRGREGKLGGKDKLEEGKGCRMDDMGM